MTLDLIVRYGIDPLFLLALLWLACTLTAHMIPTRR